MVGNRATCQRVLLQREATESATTGPVESSPETASEGQGPFTQMLPLLQESEIVEIAFL